MEENTAQRLVEYELARNSSSEKRHNTDDAKQIEKLLRENSGLKQALKEAENGWQDAITFARDMQHYLKEKDRQLHEASTKLANMDRDNPLSHNVGTNTSPHSVSASTSSINEEAVEEATRLYMLESEVKLYRRDMQVKQSEYTAAMERISTLGSELTLATSKISLGLYGLLQHSKLSQHESLVEDFRRIQNSSNVFLSNEEKSNGSFQNIHQHLEQVSTRLNSLAAWTEDLSVNFQKLQSLNNSSQDKNGSLSSYVNVTQSVASGSSSSSSKGVEPIEYQSTKRSGASGKSNSDREVIKLKVNLPHHNEHQKDYGDDDSVLSVHSLCSAKAESDQDSSNTWDYTSEEKYVRKKKADKKPISPQNCTKRSSSRGRDDSWSNDDGSVVDMIGSGGNGVDNGDRRGVRFRSGRSTKHKHEGEKPTNKTKVRNVSRQIPIKQSSSRGRSDSWSNDDGSVDDMIGSGGNGVDNGDRRGVGFRSGRSTKHKHEGGKPTNKTKVRNVSRQIPIKQSSSRGRSDSWSKGEIISSRKPVAVSNDVVITQKRKLPGAKMKKGRYNERQINLNDRPHLRSSSPNCHRQSHQSLTKRPHSASNTKPSRDNYLVTNKSPIPLRRSASTFTKRSSSYYGSPAERRMVMGSQVDYGKNGVEHRLLILAD